MKVERPTKAQPISRPAAAMLSALYFSLLSGVRLFGVILKQSKRLERIKTSADDQASSGLGRAKLSAVVVGVVAPSSRSGVVANGQLYQGDGAPGTVAFS